MIHIREAELRDVKQLAELNRQFNGVAGLSGFGSLAGERVLVAEVGREIVGFACIQVNQSICYHAPWAELTELFVHEASRRCGVGSALVDAVARVAWEQGCSEVLLRTRATNREALALFAGRGFGEVDHVCLRKTRPSRSS